MKHTILTSLTIAALLAVLVQHSFAGPLDGGKLFDGTYDPTVHGNSTGVQIQTPTFPSTGSGSGSAIAVITPPSIDGNGNVYSGTSRGGGSGTYVGKATLVYSGVQAYWTSNYRNSLGSTSPRRAPQYDRPANTAGPSANMMNVFKNPSVQTASDYRFRIDATSGQILRGTFVNGNLVAENYVGQQAKPFYNLADGRFYWTANGCQMVPML